MSSLYIPGVTTSVIRPMKKVRNSFLIQPLIEIRNGRHPCVCRTYSGGDFIPNDTVIGRWNSSSNEDCSSCVVVTGPNMGGKSTLMRQVGLIVILAQLVSFGNTVFQLN